MAHELRIKVAALTTALFLAVISAAGLGVHHQAHTQQQVASGEHESAED
jgi:hypothetical protein